VTGWLYLLVAGAFEVGFTTALKWTSEGGGWKAQAMFVVCIILSFTFLERAVATIPIGVAYAIWTGIGAVGTLLVARFVFGEGLSLAQYGFAALLILSIVGLKLSTGA
jgi:quaternary ammonium compound-resistance protein SugE